jgi:hypothetical protein
MQEIVVLSMRLEGACVCAVLVFSMETTVNPSTPQRPQMLPACCVKISRIRDWLDEAHNLLMLLWLFPNVYGAWRQNKSVVAPVVVGPEVP